MEYYESVDNERIELKLDTINFYELLLIEYRDNCNCCVNTEINAIRNICTEWNWLGGLGGVEHLPVKSVSQV